MPLVASIARRIFPLVVVTATTVPLAAFADARAYVGNFKDGTVSVVDPQKATVVATVPVGKGPHGIVASPDGRTVFVSLDGGSTVAAIDTADDRVSAAIEVGKSPHGLGVTPDGDTLLVAVYGEDRVVWIDRARRTVVGSVAVAKPHTLAVDPAGRTAWVASQDASSPGLAVVDLATRSVVRRIALPKVPRDLEYREDGRALYFTMAGENAVQVLDPASDRIVATIATGVSPHLAAVYRGASSGLVVVQGPGELLRFDPATNRSGDAIRVGEQPHWMSPFDHGRAVAVTNEGSNTLSLVDLTTGTVRSVAVGQAPRKVAVVEPPSKAASAEPVATTIAIRDFAFRPATLTVGSGTTVTWSNQDGAPHGVVFDDGDEGQELLFPGKTYAWTVAGPTTLAYHCSVHPYMTGSLVISAP